MQPDLLNSRRDRHRDAALLVKIFMRLSQDDSSRAGQLLYLGYTMTHCGERSHYDTVQNKIMYGTNNCTGPPAATPVYQPCIPQHQKINSGCQDCCVIFPKMFLLHLSTFSNHILSCTPPQKKRAHEIYVIGSFS